MKKKINVFIAFLFVLLIANIFLFFLNKQTIQCTSIISLKAKKISNEKTRAAISLLLNQAFLASFANDKVRNNSFLVDIFEDKITVSSKLRLAKIENKFIKKKILNSVNQLAKAQDLTILKENIDCNIESSQAILILPVILLILLIIYTFFIRKRSSELL